MIDEVLVEKLTKLGLTGKQAKTYASIAIARTSSIPEISRRTGLYEQDIYKIVKNLEKMGLVTRTHFKPIKVDSIELDEALDNLINLQQEKINEQKKNVKDLIKLIKSKKIQPELWEEEKFTLLPRKSEALKNRLYLVFERAGENYDCFIANDMFLRVGVPVFLTKFRRFSVHNVKARILVIVKNEEEEELRKKVSEIRWPLCELTIKTLDDSTLSYFATIDKKEVWIPTDLKGEGPVLVTDSKAVVNIAQDSFDRAWKLPKTKTIFHQEHRKDKKNN
jgi:sugar-specific transcriptional regulator TrmB